MEKLRSNKPFQTVTPLIALAVIIVVEGLTYKPYINGTIAAIIGCYVGLYLSCGVYAFWLSVICIKKPSTKKILLSTSAVTACLIVSHCAVMAVVKALSTSVVAFAFGTLLLDLILVFSFGFAITKLTELSGKKISVIVACCLLAVILAAMSAGTVLLFPKSTTPVTFTAQGLSDGNSKKVKVVLLGGQSNASGVCREEYLAKTASAEKFVEYYRGYDSVLINYFDDNGNNSSNGYFLPVRAGQGFAKGFFGPELGMAEQLSRAYPDETVIILKYAWGGTNLHEQWLPPSSDGDTGALYNAFISFVSTSMNYLRQQNYDAEIVGMCWMQGESDAFPDYATKYETNQKNLIMDIRKDLDNYISESGMYFVDAQISDSVYWTEYKTINDAKAACASSVEKTILLDTSTLEYKKEPIEAPDLCHYDSQSGIKLGNMFADAIIGAIG